MVAPYRAPPKLTFVDLDADVVEALKVAFAPWPEVSVRVVYRGQRGKYPQRIPTA